MKISRLVYIIFGVILLNSCASRYQQIKPESLSYYSSNKSGEVILEYKYNILQKKYQNNEIKKGVKLIAIKITNQSNKDLTFGKDIKLTYSNGQPISIIQNLNTYKELKQSPASYLWYLLLTPVNLYTYETSNGYQETTSSTPIGLILGPGLAGGNMLAADSANKKFKNEIINYDLNGKLIMAGETAYGLIGIRSNTYDTIKAIIE